MQRPSDPATIERLRRLCLALPEVAERQSHGEASWFVAGKQFVTTADHHHDDRLGAWCAAPEGAQEMLVQADPTRFFRPPYVGHRGWIGGKSRLLSSAPTGALHPNGSHAACKQRTGKGELGGRLGWISSVLFCVNVLTLEQMFGTLVSCWGKGAHPSRHWKRQFVISIAITSRATTTRSVYAPR